MRGKTLAVTGLLLALAACRGIESDALYARRLPGPPSAEDWRLAVPLRVMASGGAVHRQKRPMTAQDIDRDTVHRNSASCHHGPATDSSFPVWLRAYWDDRNLYLRVTWPDLTKDDAGQHWVAEQGAWRLRGGGGDGLALVYLMAGDPSFSCSRICHLDDWTVRSDIFRESARMRFAAEGMADLWLWRADARETLDLFLDERGMHTQAGPDLVRVANSRRPDAARTTGAGDIIMTAPGDGPRVDALGRDIPEGRRPDDGARAPAYLGLRQAGRGGKIMAGERYRDGLWEVTFTRPLSTGDPRDIVFDPGGVYLFGLSVMDDAMRDHHIVERAWTLKIVS